MHFCAKKVPFLGKREYGETCFLYARVRNPRTLTESSDYAPDSLKYSGAPLSPRERVLAGTPCLLKGIHGRLLQIPMIGAAYLGFAEGDVDFWCCLEVVGIILCIIRRQ